MYLQALSEERAENLVIRMQFAANLSVITLTQPFAHSPTNWQITTREAELEPTWDA